MAKSQEELSLDIYEYLSAGNTIEEEVGGVGTVKTTIPYHISRPYPLSSEFGRAETIAALKGNYDHDDSTPDNTLDNTMVIAIGEHTQASSVIEKLRHIGIQAAKVSLPPLEGVIPPSTADEQTDAPVIPHKQDYIVFSTEGLNIQKLETRLESELLSIRQNAPRLFSARIIDMLNDFTADAEAKEPCSPDVKAQLYAETVKAILRKGKEKGFKGFDNLIFGKAIMPRSASGSSEPTINLLKDTSDSDVIELADAAVNILARNSERWPITLQTKLYNEVAKAIVLKGKEQNLPGFAEVQLSSSQQRQ